MGRSFGERGASEALVPETAHRSPRLRRGPPDGSFSSLSLTVAMDPGSRILRGPPYWSAAFVLLVACGASGRSIRALKAKLAAALGIEALRAEVSFVNEEKSLQVVKERCYQVLHRQRWIDQWTREA